MRKLLVYALILIILVPFISAEGEPVGFINLFDPSGNFVTSESANAFAPGICRFDNFPEDDICRFELNPGSPVDCSEEGQYSVSFTSFYGNIQGNTGDCFGECEAHSDPDQCQGKCHGVNEEGRIPVYGINYDANRADGLCYFNQFAKNSRQDNFEGSFFENAPQGNRLCGDDRFPDFQSKNRPRSENWINDCGFMADNNKLICGNFMEGREKFQRILQQRGVNNQGAGFVVTGGNQRSGTTSQFFDGIASAASSSAQGSADPDLWIWTPAENFEREVFYLPCGGLEVISLNGEWRGCGSGELPNSFPGGSQFLSQGYGAFPKGNHDYLCLARPNDPTTDGFRGSIVECCPEQGGVADCHIPGRFATYPKSAIQKTPGEAVFSAPRNGGFEIPDLESATSPLHWHTFFKPSTSIISVERSAGITRLGTSVLNLEYNGGQDQGEEGVGVYSDLFLVEDPNPITTFYYNIEMLNSEDIKVEVYIYWYDVNNPNILSTPDKSLVFASTTPTASSNGWEKFYSSIQKPNGKDFARYVAVIRSNSPSLNGGKVLLDNFGLGKPFYCSITSKGSNPSSPEDDDTKWIGDLDQAQFPETCESASDLENNLLFKFTGNHCCGDDGLEFYADIDGGCWEGTKVEDGNLPKDQLGQLADPSILFADGKFRGCGSNFNFKSTIDGSDLVESESICSSHSSSDNPNGFFCTGAGIWSSEPTIDDGDEEQDNPTIVPASSRSKLSPRFFGGISGKPQGCCPQSFCWNGNTCIEDQSDEPWEPPTNGYRCINGDWQEATKAKFTWDNSRQGFCLEDSECLAKVNKNGLQTLACVPDRAFFSDDGFEGEGDNYCNNGEWTSRTKLIAQDLVNYAALKSPDDFTLACGNFNEIINEFGYIDEAPEADILSYLDQATNFCVLRYKDNGLEKILVSTNLNEDINAGFTNLLDDDQLLGQPGIELDCAPGTDYTFCRPNRNVLFKSLTNSVLYSKTLLTDFVQPSTTNTFITLLLNPMRQSLSLITTDLRPRRAGSVIDLSFVQQATSFDTLYLSVLGDKIVRGVLEKPNPSLPLGKGEFFSVNLYNFDSDICNSINQLNSLEVLCQIVIDESESYYEIIGLSHSPSALNHWRSLTSKLRLQDIDKSDQLSRDVPVAKIISPIDGTTFTSTDQDIHFIANPDKKAISYYWDLDSTEVIGGEFTGLDLGSRPGSTIYPEADLLAGKKKITLVAVNTHGDFSTDTVEITFTTRYGCDRQLGDIDNDGLITLNDYTDLSSIINQCADYTEQEESTIKIKCACADMNQDGQVVYNKNPTLNLDYLKFLEDCIDCDPDLDKIKSIDQGLDDNCPNDQNHGQLDEDLDGIGDACDTCTDKDGDGVGDQGFDISSCAFNLPDNCPLTPNSAQLDTDSDTAGDLCDNDKDNDGIRNADDTCPLEPVNGDCGIGSDFENGCCQDIILQGTTRVKLSCFNDEIPLFYATSATNAHLSISPKEGYNPVCVPSKIFKSTECGTKVIGLAADSNSHAEIPSLNNYPNHICLSSDINNVTCTRKALNCDTDELCIGSLSKDTNAHYGICSSYPEKICCKLG